jgi:hypothetical protein
MEARTAATPAAVVARPADAGAEASVAPVPSVAGSRRRAVARPQLLTREQEYAYIREDMRRLIIIAGALLVLMIVLLFILD